MAHAFKAPGFPDCAAWLLDLDGTLYRAPGLKLLMGIELVVRAPRNLPLLRHFRHEHERVRAEAALASDPFTVQLERTSQALELPLNRVQAVVQEWMFQRPARWLHFFRRRELLDAIGSFRAAGGRTAVVSDYPAQIKLAALGAAHLFDAVVAAGEPGGPRYLKPHPEGYLRAAERLGIEPGRCLVIGDRKDADGRAARSAGMAFLKVG